MNTKELIKNYIIFVLGVFVLSINYNLFVTPNNFVMGGAGGIAVILNQLFGFSNVITIYVINIILLFFCYIFLGKKEFKKAVIGSLLYPFFISITSPLCDLLIPYVTFNNFLITVLLCGCLCGLGNGLVYKASYNTGGGDILMKLVNKYLSIPEGSSALICNTIVLGFGTFVLGINILVYSIIVIILSSVIIDKILIGISDCKMFFIYSKKYKQIEKYILTDLHTGCTLFNTEGGFKKEKREMLMVVVPTRDYNIVKEEVLKIDNDAFFVVSDCYEVSGGIKRKNLPFI